MNFGLRAQGMLGAGQQTLRPSTAALGHNSYLREQDFFKMLAAALLLHAVIIGIASLWPEERVTDIPVRALTFKIGDTQRIAAYAPPDATPQPAAPTPAQPRPVQSLPRAIPVKPSLIPMVPPAQRQAPAENSEALEPLPLSQQPQPLPAAPAPVVTPPAAPIQQSLPDTAPLIQQAAIAPSPQRFIREPNTLGTLSGAVGGQGTETTMTAATAQAVREKYELEISTWIQRHKLYPAEAGGKEGRVVVRMRIDRTGYVRYYAIEESSGSSVLDAAAIDMVRRANPMPAVPPTYPAGNLIEFLIPIVFRVPR
jgi:protein TonB